MERNGTINEDLDACSSRGSSACLRSAENAALARLFASKYPPPPLCEISAPRASQGASRGRNRSSSLSAASAALLWEFLRYTLVGGIAFLVDFGVLVVTQELVFKHFAAGVYLSTVCGFLAGLVVNYILSLVFVFTQAKDRRKGRSIGAFLCFGIIGALGLLWTELGMLLGVAVLQFDYRFVKLFVTAAVLLWNYLGRKLIIFR